MRKYLITGSTGFLGSTIISELQKLNIETRSLGRSTKNDLQSDLSKELKITIYANYNVVIHAAGKAHIVPSSKAEEKEFFDVNFEGKRNSSVKNCV